jgi:hypothetical protein
MRNKDRAYRVGENCGDQVLGGVSALAKLTEIPIKSVVPTTRQFLLKDIVAVTLNFSTTKAMENDQGCAIEQGRAENCILVALERVAPSPFSFERRVNSRDATHFQLCYA